MLVLRKGYLCNILCFVVVVVGYFVVVFLSKTHYLSQNFEEKIVISIYFEYLT